MQASMKTLSTCSVLAASLLLGACVSTNPVVQTGPDAEITFDGLHRVDGTGRVKAWAKPDISLASYTKILPIQTGVKYKAVRSHAFNASEFELSKNEREKLEAVLQKSFAEELRDSDYFTLTDKPGADTLILEAGLIDVVSNIPQEKNTRGHIYIRTLGKATLVLELKDSMTGETLARSTEQRQAENTGPIVTDSNRATNRALIKREAKRWAKSLRIALDKMLSPN